MGEARIQYVADAAFCSVVYTGSTWYTFLRIARTYLMEIMGSAYLPRRVPFSSIGFGIQKPIFSGAVGGRGRRKRK